MLTLQNTGQGIYEFVFRAMGISRREETEMLRLSWERVGARMMDTNAQWQGRIMEPTDKNYTWYYTGVGTELERQQASVEEGEEKGELAFLT